MRKCLQNHHDSDRTIDFQKNLHQRLIDYTEVCDKLLKEKILEIILT